MVALSVKVYVLPYRWPKVSTISFLVAASEIFIQWSKTAKLVQNLINTYYPLAFCHFRIDGTKRDADIIPWRKMLKS